ncbi:MAG: PfkB family carbohydrate kinase [Huintestinicola sp.]|uniref:PfkB family carbohydrate kinase n=1 Tax=Huintestinicola sp. TaxID=2981661 RepID=UPI003EFE3141
MKKIYLYGMIIASNSFRLKEFPEPDRYSEIEESCRFPGGETGTCATVLSSLGANVILDGTYIGRNSAQLIKDFYKNKSVNCDLLHFDDSFEGLEDYVIITGDARTPMGTFGHFFSSAFSGGIKRWNKPDEKAVSECDCAAIDPFFGEDSDLAAEYCIRHGKPYVTIDCKYDSFLHRNSAVSVISGEGLNNDYPDMTREEIFPLFQENGNGLTIITNGGKEFLYGRKGGELKTFQPFRVDVKSTLGAGDTFKAGCTYALSMGMNDNELVRFASACAAVAVSRYPSQLYPPAVSEVERLIKSR